MNLFRPSVLKLNSFSHLTTFCFSNIPTNYGQYIQKIKDYPKEQTRSELIQSNNPQTIEQIKMITKEEKKKLVYSYKSNDSNPSNYITVKIRPPIIQSIISTSKPENPEILENKSENKTNNSAELTFPTFKIITSRKPKILIEGVRRKVFSKIKKLLVPMRGICGLHIYEAIEFLSRKKTKAFKLVLVALNQVRNHAFNRGLDESRLYVNSALTGKLSRRTRLRYHGKGRSGRLKHDFCQLRIRLEEKSYEDLYKLMILGKTPPMLAFNIRMKLRESNAGLDVIRRLTGILTAKGRQQRKLMFKRKVQKIYMENLVLLLYRFILKILE